ncbi:MAG: hypothetical protein K6T17_00645 [Fimbriimonadales bacterium]|nr:hypothetical protein [Fimbriimonadales bacterium]
MTRKQTKQALKKLQEVFEAAGALPEDPGLRGKYPSLPRAPIKLICCPLDKPMNMGSMLRIAECFRIEEVVFSPSCTKEARDFIGAVGAEKWQPYRFEDPLQALESARAKGYRIYGFALREGAVAIRKVRWQFPTAIVMGNEARGLSPEVADLCDEFVGIPLFGLVNSLNVAMASTIALEHAVHHYYETHSEFVPARRISRKLLGIEE